MPFLSENDKVNLQAIVEASKKIKHFTKGLENADEFYDDEKTFDAVLMNFVVIGESVAKLSKACRVEHQHIPWVKVKAFRNIITHNYFGVDAEEVWQIIQNQIPQLIKEVRKIIR
jgi:uncharacterized protein with HEPN domain